jgi:hypothetical protein
MEYSISINFVSNDNQNFNATATFSGKQNDIANYSFKLPNVNIFGNWHACSNSEIFSNFSYTYNTLLYKIMTYSTYLNDATSNCPNFISIVGNNKYYNTNLYSYESKCNNSNSSNSVTGNYLDTVVNLSYDINTNVVSNLNCNTDITSIKVTSGPKNTTYNFYSKSNIILTMQCSSNYSASGLWTIEGINIINYGATKAQTIVAISFLCNMYYNLSYYTYFKKINSSAFNAQLVVINGLAPLIQIFNEIL